MPVTISEENPKIRDFLNRNHLGILATSTLNGEPHAATIYFLTDEDFNFYFLSKEETTKSRNLEQNPHAALAVYEAEMQTTLQITGLATKIDDPTRVQEIFTGVLEIAKDTSMSSIPPISQVNAGGYVAYHLRPKVLRLAEYVKAQHNTVDKLFEIEVLPG